MPLRLYECIGGHDTEALFDGAYPKDIDCPECGLMAHYRHSAPAFFVEGSRAPIDTAKEAWSGTALEDSDGINQTQYRSTKAQIDYGQRKPPPTTKPVDPVDRMLGIHRS